MSSADLIENSSNGSTEYFDDGSYYSISSSSRKPKEVYVDKERHVIYRNIQVGVDPDTDRPIYRKSRIVMFETKSTTGRTIRNAVSGLRDVGYHAGTYDENLYFVVTHATGETGSREPINLYYDSPEQWERHMNVVCPMDVKERWLEKRAAELDKRKRTPVKKPIVITC